MVKGGVDDVYDEKKKMGFGGGGEVELGFDDEVMALEGEETFKQALDDITGVKMMSRRCQDDDKMMST